MSDLLDLPDEILLLVLSPLPIADIVGIVGVCTRLNNLAALLLKRKVWCQAQRLISRMPAVQVTLDVQTQMGYRAIIARVRVDDCRDLTKSVGIFGDPESQVTQYESWIHTRVYRRCYRAVVVTSGGSVQWREGCNRRTYHPSGDPCCFE